MAKQHINNKRRKKRRMRPRWGRIFLALIVLGGLLWGGGRWVVRSCERTSGIENGKSVKIENGESGGIENGELKIENDQSQEIENSSADSVLSVTNTQTDAAAKPSATVSAAPANLRELLGGGDNPWDKHLEAMPDDGCIKLKINPIGGSLAKVFDDVNALHLEAAQQLGLNAITSEAEAWRLKRPIVEIRSCAEYYVDDLRHSYPFLVPEAARLLKDIGAAFNAELAARGGGAYRLKVTSVTRTPLTVGKLQRVNRNATSESAHQYGTTFDISYGKFICDDDTQPRRTQEDLKNLLAEVLQRLRAEGRCYVKYEHKQACFHITVRC